MHAHVSQDIDILTEHRQESYDYMLHSLLFPSKSQERPRVH